MKKLIVIAIAAVAALNSAWLVEGSSSNCAAVERLAVRQTAINMETKYGTAHAQGMFLAKGLFGLSDGRFAAHIAAENSPGVPTPIVCAVTYWNGWMQGGKP